MNRRRWLRILGLLLLSYLIVVTILLLLENKLIFPAWQIPEGDWQPVNVSFEPVWLTSEDGVRIFAWYLDQPQPRAWVLFCHGNGETVAHAGPELAELGRQLQVAILVFDYRGYGKSQGRPHEQGVLADGRAAQRWLAERSGRAPHQLVYWGRSLGAAIALDLAADQGAAGLILERAFTRMPDVAASHFPWVPVRWMRTRFDCLSKIRHYEGPILQTHGTRDEVVPFKLGRRLFDAAVSPQKTFLEFPGLRHNDPNPPEFADALRAFFADLPHNAPET